jgi:putative hydrolase of the HAD superfamily
MIFFDIDGTLIDHAHASAAASLKFFDHYSGAIPFKRDQFPAAWEEILNQHFNRFCRGEISLWEQRRARMRDVFGAPELSDDEADSRYCRFIGEYESLTRAYDDAIPCLDALVGERLGIISNGARDQQIGKLKRAGLFHYFSVLVFSEDVGLGKPHHRIFLDASNKAGEDPAHCIHVGDDVAADVMGSHALGIQAVWLDRHAIFECPIPAPRITTLSELAKVLGREARSGQSPRA